MTTRDGGIGELHEWAKRNRNRSRARTLAAGVFVVAVSTPQLFIEGNRRTATLLASYVLARAGVPPLVVTPNDYPQFDEISERALAIDRGGFASGFALTLRCQPHRRLPPRYRRSRLPATAGRCCPAPANRPDCGFRFRYSRPEAISRMACPRPKPEPPMPTSLSLASTPRPPLRGSARRGRRPTPQSPRLPRRRLPQKHRPTRRGFPPTRPRGTSSSLGDRTLAFLATAGTVTLTNPARKPEADMPLSPICSTPGSGRRGR